MLRVGLVGPTASGKSTVAGLLAQEGIPVLDADREAHALYQPGSPLVAAIAEVFGDETLDPRGGVDRRALGRIVFADPERMRELETLVHPPLKQRLREAMDALAASGHRLVVLEAAVLLKWRETAVKEDAAARLVDTIVGVIAQREVRLRRLREQGFTPAEAASRLDRQVDEDRLRRVADLLIENNGDVRGLREKVHSLAAALHRLALDAGRP